MDIDNAAAQIGADLFGTEPTPPAAEEVKPLDSAVEDIAADASDSVVPDTGSDIADKGADEGSEVEVPAVVKKPAPQTWRPEAAQLWDQLPEKIQDEVLKREEDIFKGIEGYKQDAAMGKDLRNVLAPYADMYRQYNVDPRQHIGSLLGMHKMLLTGSPQDKQELVLGLAKQFGVELGQQTIPDYIDPELDKVRQELATLRREQQAYFAQTQEAKISKATEEVEKFASDTKNAYFSELVNDIAELIEGSKRQGKQLSLPEAYEKAIWLNPSTRAKEQARLQTEALEKQKKESAERAAKAAKATAANIRTSSKAVSDTTPTGTMDDTLQETLQQIKARNNR